MLWNPPDTRISKKTTQSWFISNLSIIFWTTRENNTIQTYSTCKSTHMLNTITSTYHLQGRPPELERCDNTFPCIHALWYKALTVEATACISLLRALCSVHSPPHTPTILLHMKICKFVHGAWSNTKPHNPINSNSHYGIHNISRCSGGALY